MAAPEYRPTAYDTAPEKEVPQAGAGPPTTQPTVGNHTYGSEETSPSTSHFDPASPQLATRPSQHLPAHGYARRPPFFPSYSWSPTSTDQRPSPAAPNPLYPEFMAQQLGGNASSVSTGHSPPFPPYQNGQAAWLAHSVPTPPPSAIYARFPSTAPPTPAWHGGDHQSSSGAPPLPPKPQQHPFPAPPFPGIGVDRSAPASLYSSPSVRNPPSLTSLRNASVSYANPPYGGWRGTADGADESPPRSPSGSTTDYSRPPPPPPPPVPPRPSIESISSSSSSGPLSHFASASNPSTSNVDELTNRFSTYSMSDSESIPAFDDDTAPPGYRSAYGTQLTQNGSSPPDSKAHPRGFPVSRIHEGSDYELALRLSQEDGSELQRRRTEEWRDFHKVVTGHAGGDMETLSPPEASTSSEKKSSVRYSDEPGSIAGSYSPSRSHEASDYDLALRMSREDGNEPRRRGTEEWEFFQEVASGGSGDRDAEKQALLERDRQFAVELSQQADDRETARLASAAEDHEVALLLEEAERRRRQELEDEKLAKALEDQMMAEQLEATSQKGQEEREAQEKADEQLARQLAEGAPTPRTSQFAFNSQPSENEAGPAPAIQTQAGAQHTDTPPLFYDVVPPSPSSASGRDDASLYYDADDRSDSTESYGLSVIEAPPSDEAPPPLDQDGWQRYDARQLHSHIHPSYVNQGTVHTQVYITPSDDAVQPPPAPSGSLPSPQASMHLPRASSAAFTLSTSEAQTASDLHSNGVPSPAYTAVELPAERSPSRASSVYTDALSRRSTVSYVSPTVSTPAPVNYPLYPVFSFPQGAPTPNNGIASIISAVVPGAAHAAPRATAGFSSLSPVSDLTQERSRPSTPQVAPINLPSPSLPVESSTSPRRSPGPETPSEASFFTADDTASIREMATSPAALHPDGEESSTQSSSRRGATLSAQASLAMQPLEGISIGFNAPPNDKGFFHVQREPAFFPDVVLLEPGAPLYISALTFRNVLRALAHFGATRIEAPPGLIATVKATVQTNIVVQFTRMQAQSQDWRCIVHVEVGPWQAGQSNVPKTRSNIPAHPGPLSLVIPLTTPPPLPMTMNALADHLRKALSYSRDSTDTNGKRLHNAVLASDPEEAASPHTSGPRRWFKIGSRAQPRDLNEDTYDLVTPFILSDVG